MTPPIQIYGHGPGSLQITKHPFLWHITPSEITVSHTGDFLVILETLESGLKEKLQTNNNNKTNKLTTSKVYKLAVLQTPPPSPIYIRI